MSEVSELELIELGEVSVETKGQFLAQYFENVIGQGCVRKKPTSPSTC